MIFPEESEDDDELNHEPPKVPASKKYDAAYEAKVAAERALLPRWNIKHGSWTYKGATTQKLTYAIAGQGADRLEIYVPSDATTSSNDDDSCAYMNEYLTLLRSRGMPEDDLEDLRKVWDDIRSGNEDQRPSSGPTPEPGTTQVCPGCKAVRPIDSFANAKGRVLLRCEPCRVKSKHKQQMSRSE
jgi:hypothetical protein